MIVRLALQSVFYKTHLAVRYLHDIVYSKNKIYKRYSDNPVTSKVHHATMWAFIASFAAFTFLQYIVPEFFSFVAPNQVYAGSNSKTWTTKGDFNNGTIKSNINIEGNLDTDDSLATLANPEIDFDTVSSSAGRDFSLAIKSDGTLWSWGGNQNGQLGIGNTTSSTSPVQVGALNNWKSITSGDNHSLGIKSDGTLWSWGYNHAGQLGLGNNTQRTAPVQVGVDSNWKSVTSGMYHVLAIKTNGTLWSWGLNSSGQLGQGNTTNLSTPTQVGTASDWKIVASGGSSTMAIKTDGTLWGWGLNTSGQLGLSDTVQRNVPTQVGSATDWKFLAPTFYHTLAIKTDGTLWGWGNNEFGKVGVASTSTPTKIVEENNWKVVAAGQSHSLAIKGDGTLWGWGGNSYGQLGLGDKSNRGTPTQVGVNTNWKIVTVGINHTVATKYDGTIWSWGNGESGQLGHGGTATYTYDEMDEIYYYDGNLDKTTPTSIGAGVNWRGIGLTYPSSGTISNLKLNAGSKASWGNLSWNGTEPANTNIKFRTRGADTEGGLSGATWSAYYETSPATITTSASQWLEVELTLESSDGASTPTLNDFTVAYNTLDAPTTPKSFKSDNTEINVTNTNGYTNETSVTAKATIPIMEGFPTDGSIVLTPEIELRTDTSFTGNAGVPAGITFTPTNINYTGASTDASFGTISGLSVGSNYHYKIRYTDNSGRVSPWSSTYSTVSVEQTAPTGTVSINSGAQYATSNNVTLTLSATDTGGSTLKNMRFSNDATTWSEWENYNTTKSWTLASGDGVKNVYVQYKDGAGNVSGAIFDNEFNGLFTNTVKTGSSVALRGLPTNNYGDSSDGYITDSASPAVNNTTTNLSISTDDFTYMNYTFIKFTNLPDTEVQSATLNLYASQNFSALLLKLSADFGVLDTTDLGIASTSLGSRSFVAGWNNLDLTTNVNQSIFAGQDYIAFRIQTSTENTTFGFGSFESTNKPYLSYSLIGGGTPPYISSGTYTSSVLDADISDPVYGDIFWNSSVPTSTDLTLRVRAGDTSTPDGSWTGWSADLSNNSSLSAYNNYRYIQYQVTLMTSDSAHTPALYAVSVGLNNATSDAITLDTTPPSNISNLKSYQNNTKSNLLNETTWYDYTAPYFEWDASTDGDFKEYKYCFGTNSSCDPTAGTSLGITNNYTANLVAGSDGPRYFRVVAIDNADNPSTTVTQVIYKLDLSLPGAVTGYTASQTYEDYIRVSWSPVGAAGGSSIRYVLERIPYQTYIEDGYTKLDVEPDKVWSDLTTYKAFPATTATSIDEYVSTDEGIVNRLQAGVKYVYRIRAIDELNRYGNYQNDPFFGLTRDGLDPLPPTNVTALACSYQNPENCETTDNALKGHQAIIRWSPGSDAGTGIIAYRIYRATTNHQLEASYSLLTTINVPNPLPAMDEYDTLLYYDNNLTDYTTYHYRIVAVDGSDPANTSRIVKNLTDVGNYAYTITPDVTAPTTPVPSTAGGGLDSSNEHQKVIITWSPSTDTGAGIKTYKLYRADRYDETDLSGTLTDNDFIEITASASVTCTMNSRECVEEGLEDNRYYYYRLKAVDNDPYNNESPYSATSTVKTSSSAVPSPARGRKDPNTQIYEPFPYAISTKGDPTITNSTVGTEITLTFTGSYLKDNLPYLLKYEIYRSTDRTNWTKIGNDITPIRNDDDRDNTYTFTDSNLDDATTYYYKVRSVGNNPDIEGGGESYSGIGNNLNQAWDITPDVTGPSIPVGGLEVKVRDTHPNEFELRNIITWKMLTSEQMPTRNGSVDFLKYEVHREVVHPTTGAVISDTNVGNVTALGDNYLVDIIPIAFADLKYKYYVVIVDNAATEFKYSTDAVINAYSNVSAREYWVDSIVPSQVRPVLSGSVTVTNVGVSTAVVNWVTSQEADSLVQFRPKGSNENWVAIGQIERSTNHRVNLFGLKPTTAYEYQLVSRNYLGNNVEYEQSSLPTLTTSGFTITPGTVTTTTSTTEITWSTNLNASSAFVEYQLQRQPGDEPQGGTAGVDPSTILTSPKNHKVVLKGLRSARTYTYKIKSISSDGYLSEYPGGEFANFKTRSFDSEQFTLAPSSSNVAERNITATTAQIVWQTENPTTSWVDYSTKSGTYDNAAGNNDMVRTHVVVIEGLIPGTTYYYRVRVKDANEVEYTSQEYSFTAILKPKISNMTVKNITPYSVTIAWDTNVDTETIINWGTTTAYGEKRGKSGVSKVHELTIDNLLDNQEYHYQILAKDDAGNEVADTDKIVRTPLDTEGPKITGVKLDVLPMGENDTTSSVIVTWQTNKPATTLVEYDEGVIGGTYNKSSVEDTSLNNSHTVIIKDLQPASSYHYRLVSTDKRSNKTVSQDYTFVTPSKEKSIIQLIIKSLEETFAWTKNLNQFFGNIGNRMTGR